MKKVRLILSPEAEDTYAFLNKESTSAKLEHTLLNAIHKKSAFVKANPHYGNPIAKSLIPAIYKVKYGATNLFRVELPFYWRMLYALTDGDTENEIIAFVIEILDHKEYDKRFGYRKR